MIADCRDPVDFYRDHGLSFDKKRPRSLYERDWLDGLLAPHEHSSFVLDVGCGCGDPITRFVAGEGFHVVGMDTAPAMLNLAKSRIAGAEFIECDMRSFQLDQQFDAIVAWDSFFHLSRDEQRKTLTRFSDHLKPRATLLFTAGHVDGEVSNPMFGEPLYHASLEPAEYRERLLGLGFSIMRYTEQDEKYGARTIWLAGRGLDCN